MFFGILRCIIRLWLEYWVLHQIKLICSVWLHYVLKIAYHITNSLNIRILCWWLFLCDFGLINFGLFGDIFVFQWIFGSICLFYVMIDYYIFITYGILSIISCKNCLFLPISGLLYIPHFFALILLFFEFRDVSINILFVFVIVPFFWLFCGFHKLNK